MELICMRGVPGSGKTTFAQELNRDLGAVIVSADDYFMVDGVYCFDPKLLSAAHGSCFKRAIEAAQAGRSVLVDNTCISPVEIAPYMLLAQAYGLTGMVKTILTNPFVAAGRNVHGVPVERVITMDAALQDAKLPPWWAHEVLSR